jgi:hypothetical protein
MTTLLYCRRRVKLAGSPQPFTSTAFVFSFRLPREASGREGGNGFGVERAVHT